MEDSRGQSNQLNLSLFGEFKYHIVGLGPQSLKSRKSEAVLLALALNGKTGLSRQAIAAMLWADLPQDRARAGLRQALSRIRGLNSDIFYAPQPGWIALNPEISTCDLWTLSEAIKENTLNSNILPRSTLLKLHPNPTPDFEDWISTQKRFILEQLQENLDKIIKNNNLNLLHRNHAAAALSTLTQTDELRISTLLDFYLETGDHIRYEKRRLNYTERLEKELGLKPSIQFLSKYSQISNIQDTETVSSIGQTLAVSLSTPILAIVEEFRLIGASEHQTHYAKSVPDDIIAHLTRQEWFDVTALNPNIQPNSKNTKRMYGHVYSVIGSLRFSKDNISASIRLTNQDSGKIIWSQSYEEPIGENDYGVLKIVDIASESILTKMVDSAAEYAATIPEGAPSSDWIDTMKARRLFWRTSKVNNLSAKQLLQPIIEKDTAPISALVTATFTRLLTVWSAWETDCERHMQEARHIAEKAVRLFPNDPWSHFSLATCYCALRRHTDALRTIEHALALHDSFSTAIGLRGHIKAFSGQVEEGREDLMHALTLNPVDPHFGIWQNSVGITFFLNNQNQEALNWVKKAQSANSYWMQNYVLLVCVHSALGNQVEAEKNYRSLKKIAPNLSKTNWLYSHPFADQSTQVKFLKHLEKFGF